MGLTAVTYAMQLLTSLPGLIQAGRDVLDVVNHGKEKLNQMQVEKRDPTKAEWQELNDKIKDLRDELHDED